jgi:hypothetical protein
MRWPSADYLSGLSNFFGFAVGYIFSYKPGCTGKAIIEMMADIFRNNPL